MKVLYEDDIFPQGKYKGETVSAVCKKDPIYIQKFDRLYGNLCISDEVINDLNANIET